MLKLIYQLSTFMCTYFVNRNLIKTKTFRQKFGTTELKEKIQKKG